MNESVALFERTSTDSGEFLRRVTHTLPLIQQESVGTERDRSLSPALLQALHRDRMFRMLLPRSLGGLELDPISFARAMEMLATVDGSTAWCVGQASGCAMAAAYLPPWAAAQVFSDPSSVLAWGPGQGQAARVDNGYLVTGTWRFASGSGHATWLGARCTLEGTDPAAGITVLFPKSQAAMKDIWKVMGLKGTGSNEYSLDKLFVPADFSFEPDYTLVPTDTCSAREPGSLYKLSGMIIYSVAFASVALGLARAALDQLIVLTGAKLPRAAPHLMKFDPTVQLQVGQAEAKLRSARAFLFETIGAIWSDVLTGAVTVDIDARMNLRLASTNAIHAATEVVESAYKMAGASAIFESAPFERRFRDMYSVSQQLQGRMGHMVTYGKHILGADPDLTFV
jgi:alkylation response protein AidB-like acyl-CoA dehydrogenase